MHYQYSRTYRDRVRLVVFDWAGTIVDYGCQAPIAAFVAGFQAMGVEVGMEVARGPMGMEKRDHIRTVAAVDEVAKAWMKKHGRPISEADINSMYDNFVALLLAQLKEQSKLLPYITETVATLRNQGIKIGSSTGYFTEAADIVSAQAAEEGFRPDYSICSSDVAVGRPAPWMIYRVMEKLNVSPPEAVINVGDTPVDIESGLNAGVWTVGVAATGNQMGLTEKECGELGADAYTLRLEKARTSLAQAGAHWVIDTMQELPAIVMTINALLAAGKKP